MSPEAFAELVVTTIETALAPLRLQQAALAAQVTALETRVLPSILAVLERQYQPGPPGPAGPPGPPGADGLDGKDGRPGLRFAGVYVDGQAYDLGDLVTWGGSSWHCNGATTSKPGEGSKAWTLMVKRGRDGRGGA